MHSVPEPRPARRWPLTLIAAPAAVAVWSGWVGLGEMCGFGIVHPLPGIASSLQLNTAITLPVGVEAYGAYALGAWLAPAAVPAGARKFARNSAIGALVLGMAGQVIYHLLAAAGAHKAPWPVVMLVACLPVVTLGFGAALTHLLRGGAAQLAPAAAAGASVPDVPGAGSGPGTPAEANGEAFPDAASRFGPEIEAGQVPTIADIRAALHCGQAKAQRVQAYLRPLARTR